MSEGRGISVTLKYPKPKYQDAPWIVFHAVSAEEVRQDIVDAFGWEADAVDGLVLHEVVLKAQEAVQAHGGVANDLGGKVLSGGGSKSSAWSQAGSRASEQAEGGEEKEPEDPTAWLKVEIDKATSKDGLKRLWADNKAAFNAHPELLELWKDKGKSLAS